jgi:hypothetical protein
MNMYRDLKDNWKKKKERETMSKLTTMLQIARPQSTITPIALTRGLKEMCSERNGNEKVHSRTGNFSCAS